jgi:hypothetical protein
MYVFLEEYQAGEGIRTAARPPMGAASCRLHPALLIQLLVWLYMWFQFQQGFEPKHGRRR